MGILLLTGLAAGIGQAFVPESEGPTYGPVEGKVMYRGRPVAAGRISFLEDGHPLCEAVHAPIAASGYYQCPPYWVADRSTRRRYRIFVDLLEPEEATPPRPKAEAAGSGRAGGNLVPLPYPVVGSRPVAQVVRSAMESPHPDEPTRPVVRSPRHRFSDSATTDLAVWLDHEAARVDVELKD